MPKIEVDTETHRENERRAKQRDEYEVKLRRFTRIFEAVKGCECPEAPEGEEQKEAFARGAAAMKAAIRQAFRMAANP